MRLCPSRFLTVRPRDRPGFRNGDRDGAADDWLHGVQHTGFVSSIEAKNTQKLRRITQLCIDF